MLQVVYLGIPIKALRRVLAHRITLAVADSSATLAAKITRLEQRPATHQIQRHLAQTHQTIPRVGSSETWARTTSKLQEACSATTMLLRVDHYLVINLQRTLGLLHLEIRIRLLAVDFSATCPITVIPIRTNRTKAVVFLGQIPIREPQVACSVTWEITMPLQTTTTISRPASLEIWVRLKIKARISPGVFSAIRAPTLTITL